MSPLPPPLSECRPRDTQLGAINFLSPFFSPAFGVRAPRTSRWPASRTPKKSTSQAPQLCRHESHGAGFAAEAAGWGVAGDSARGPDGRTDHFHRLWLDRPAVRGGAEARGCGGAGVRGRGSAEARERGSAEARGRGSAGPRECGSAGPRGRGRAGVRVRGGAGVRERGSAGARECGSAEWRSRLLN